MIAHAKRLLLAVFFAHLSRDGLGECAWVLWNDEARLDYATQAESAFVHPIAGTVRKTECEARLLRNRPRAHLTIARRALLKVLGTPSSGALPFDKPITAAGIQTFGICSRQRGPARTEGGPR